MKWDEESKASPSYSLKLIPNVILKRNQLNKTHQKKDNTDQKITFENSRKGRMVLKRNHLHQHNKRRRILKKKYERKSYIEAKTRERKDDIERKSTWHDSRMEELYGRKNTRKKDDIERKSIYQNTRKIELYWRENTWMKRLCWRSIHLTKHTPPTPPHPSVTLRWFTSSLSGRLTDPS